LALTLSAAGSASAQCPDPDETLDRIVFAETVDGDCQAAVELADQALACRDLSDDARTTLEFRKAICLQALGHAEDAFGLLKKLASRNDPNLAAVRAARKRLSDLETAPKVRSLPYRPDLSSVPATIYPQELSGPVLDSVEGGEAHEWALRWRTVVSPGATDYLTLPIECDLAGARLRMQVRTSDLEASLHVYLVQRTGHHFLIGTVMVNPGEDWAAVDLPLSAARPYPSGSSDQRPDLGSIRYLMIQDTAGYVFQRQGANEIYIADLVLER
jgi:tetratricopeptide (TPR) repeat protein